MWLSSSIIFEPDHTDWSGSYALAFSVDGTALVLTVGVMFFASEMKWYSKLIVWAFIIGLTAFSWSVNWEYAVRFQSHDLTTNTTLLFLNPILASAFAVLNLAYAITSEFFNVRVKTIEQMQEEVADLKARSSIEKLLKEAKGPSLI